MATFLLNVLLPVLLGAAAGGAMTWLLTPGIARRQADAAIAAERPRLKVIFPGWGVIGPYLIVFNVGGRKTTVTEVGWYAADGSVGGSIFPMWEQGADKQIVEAVDAFHPPKAGYLPKPVDAGDYIDIPLFTTQLRDGAFPAPPQCQSGLSGFWVREADGTVTAAEAEPAILSGFPEWLGVRPPQAT
jgi:hypothetical protein